MLRRALVNLSTLSLLSVILLLGQPVSAQCLSGNYTIGGFAPDYRNFAEAINALTTKGVCGPVIFNVRDSIYHEQLSIPAISGASATNTIVFQSGSFTTAVQAPVSATNTKPVLELNNSKWVKFKGIKFVRTAGTGTNARVVQISGTASNLGFEQSGFAGVTTANYNQNYDLVASDGGNYQELTFNNCSFENGNTGIFLNNQDSTGRGLSITNCNFSGNTGYSIFVNKYLAPQITHCTFNVDRNSQYLYSPSVYLRDCTDSCRVSKCKFTYSTARPNIYFDNVKGTASAPVIIDNNFLPYAEANGIWAQNSSYIWIVNNSVDHRLTSGWGIYLDNTTNSKILNNCIVGSNQVWLNAASGISCDYNNYLATNLSFKIGSTLYSYANWRTTTGYDSHSYISAPNYISTSDLHISSNPFLNNHGIAVAGITSDIDDEARSNTPDIGADEFVPVTNDLKVLLITPSFPVCPGPQNVQMLLQNYGGNTISSFRLNWIVNGTTQATYDYTGSLQSGDSANVTIGTFNFKPDSTYSLKAWVSSLNGQSSVSNPKDDTLTVGGKTRLSGAYTIGGIKPAYKTIALAFSDMASRGVCGPVTFNIRDGLYEESVVYGLVSGVSAENTITVQSESADSSAVLWQGTYNNYALQIAGSFFRLRNVTVTNQYVYSNFYSYFVQVAAGCTDIIIERNKFFSKASGGYTSPNLASTFIYLDNGARRGLTIRNNRFVKGDIGIGMGYNNFNYSKDLRIENNVFDGQAGCGAYIYRLDSSVIANNIFTPLDSVSNVDYTGLDLYYCQRSNISANIINARYGSGMHIYQTSIANADTLRITNNFISTKNTAVKFELSTGVLFYHNTVNLTDSSINSNIYTTRNTNSAIGIYNNIFANNKGGKIFRSTPTGITSNWNVFYTTGAFSNAYPNLEAWQLSGKDSNSVSLDPGFFSAEDLHITNTSLNGIANRKYLLERDIDGDKRNSLALVPGADEIAPATIDLKVALTTPPGGCKARPGIYVNVTNQSADTVWSFQLCTRVNNTMVDTLYWRGVLPPAGTLPNIKAANYLFTYGVDHDVKIWSTLPNHTTDINPANDTAQISNLNWAMGGTYTIGGEKADFVRINDALSALYKMGVCDSVTFRIRPNYYTEVTVLQGAIPGSSTSNTVTFVSDAQDTASVIWDNYNVPNNPYSSYIPLWIRGASNLTFRQITFRAPEVYATFAYYRAMQISGGSSNLRFDGNRFIGDITDSFSTSNYYTGNNFLAGTLKFINHPVQLGGSHTIANNLFSGVYYYSSGYNLYYSLGVTLDHQSDYVVEGNIFHTTIGPGSIYLESCGGGRIDNNRIDDFTANGSTSNYTLGIYNAKSSANAPIYVRNNMLYSGAGVILSKSPYVRFYHNTVSSIPVVTITNSPNTELMNNIFVSTGTKLIVDAFQSITCDYNLFSDSLVSIKGSPNNSVTTYTLKQWQSLRGADLHSEIGLPEFEYNGTRTGNYPFPYPDPNKWNPLHYNKNTQLIYRTINRVGSVPLDIDSEQRDVIPCYGADEYTIPDNNVSITSLPASTTIPCSGTGPVQVVLTNYGTKPVLGTDIRWVVNGAPQPTYHWTGYINPLDSITITIGSYNFEEWKKISLLVWPELPNGQVDAYTRFDTISTTIYTAMHGDYYIGKDSAADFKNFAEAANSLVLRGVCAAVTMRVRPGSYNEQFIIKEFRGSSAVNTVTFESEPLDKTSVVIAHDHSGNGESTDYTVSIQGADHLRFRYLTMKAIWTHPSTVTTRVVHISYGSNDIQFTDNHIETVTIGYYFDYMDAVYIGADYLENADNNAIVFRRNTIIGGSAGIGVEGVEQSDMHTPTGLIIDSNTIDGAAYAFDIRSVSGAIITNNICGARTYNEASISLRGCSGKYLIANNEFHGNHYGFIAHCGKTGNDTGIIANNIMNDAVVMDTRFEVQNNKNLLFAYNTINCNTTVNNAALVFFNNNAVRLVNNIITTSNGNVLNWYTNTNCYSNYNCYRSNTNTLGKFENVKKDKLADWQLASGMDMNSVSIDPVFVSGTDLHFTNPFLSGLGTPIQEIKKDKDGVVRSGVKPDIGAYENNMALAKTDVAIITILPADTVCAGTWPLKAVIANKGNIPVYLFQINWSANNVAQPVYNYNGYIAAGGYDTVTLNAAYTFNGLASYSFATTLTLPSNVIDSFQSNNSAAITIASRKPINAYLGNDTTICVGETLTLHPVDDGTYNWSDGTHDAGMTVDKVGIYSVTVTAGNTCRGTDTISVAVSAPKVNLGNDTTVCTGQTLTINAGNFTEYAWSTGATSPSISIDETGIYSVVVTNNIGCTATDSIAAAVLFDLPKPNLGNDTTICGGDRLLLNAGIYDSYKWSNQSNNRSITVTKAGTYSVEVYNEGSCHKRDTVIIDLNTFTINLGDDASICYGDSVLLTVGDFVNYKWNTGSTYNQLWVTKTGTYTVTVTNEENCKNADSIAITVYTLPSAPTISYNGSKLTSTFGYSYTWYLNGQLMIGENGQSVFDPVPGTYTVEITDRHDCTSILSAPFTITGIGSLEEATFNVYPNPAQDRLFIQLSNKPTQAISIKLLNIFGQIIVERTNSGSETIFEIDLSSFSSGAYLLQVNDGDKEGYFKVVKL